MPHLFRRFLKNPLEIGSIADSSKYLARAMAKHANLIGPVLEIGAGTGPITKALVTHIPATASLTLVEFDPHLASTLRQRFPTLPVHAQDVEAFLGHDVSRYSAIVSGIPFAVMDAKKRTRVFELIKEHLQPDGTFVMFQYSRRSEKELQAFFGKENVARHFVPLNIPPAFVFVGKK